MPLSLVCEAIGYADDLEFCCKGKDLRTISERIRFAVKIVENRCLKVGLRSQLSEYKRLNEKQSHLEMMGSIGFTENTIFGEKIPLKEEVLRDYQRRSI